MSEVKIRCRVNESRNTVVSVDGRFVTWTTLKADELARVIDALVKEMPIENTKVEFTK